MRNFDAVSSDWCFPEGFSIVGISHWNKFHASVLMNRRLMEKVGGYDPAIPWGLEDWNFWLRASVHNPIVRFVPEITFFYRHHQGTSMRKKMFALYLDQTKAMVRTNHVELYEPVQLLVGTTTDSPTSVTPPTDSPTTTTPPAFTPLVRFKAARLSPPMPAPFKHHAYTSVSAPLTSSGD